MRKAKPLALLLTCLLMAACSAGAQTTHSKRPTGPPPRIGDELAGTKWQAEMIDGQPVPDPALMTLDFLPSDQVRGQAGCNRFVGPVASRADKVTLGILRQSRLPCPEPESAQQQQLIDMLHRAWRAELGDDTLTFYDRQGRSIRFVARPN